MIRTTDKRAVAMTTERMEPIVFCGLGGTVWGLVGGWCTVQGAIWAAGHNGLFAVGLWVLTIAGGVSTLMITTLLALCIRGLVRGTAALSSNACGHDQQLGIAGDLDGKKPSRGTIPFDSGK